MKEESVALNCNSVGGEAEPSTMGRAGLTFRPPMVVVRSIGGGGIYETILNCCIYLQLLTAYLRTISSGYLAHRHDGLIFDFDFRGRAAGEGGKKRAEKMS